MRRLFAILTIGLVVTLIFAGSISAEETRPTTPSPSADPDSTLSQYNIPLDLGPEGETLNLSLEEAVFIALRNNLGIEGARYSLRSSREDVTKEDAAFDLVFFGSIPLKREKTVIASSGMTSLYSNASYDIGIRRRLRTGTYYQVSLTDEFTQYTNPMSINRSTLLFTLSQPLYRNAGRKFNSAMYEIAINNREIALLTLESQINDLIYNVSSAYWNLALATDGLQVALRAKNLAEELYRTTDNLVKSGAEKELARLQALNGVASREEDVLLARLGVKTAEDNLKMYLNLSKDGSIPNTVIKLSDRPEQKEVSCEFEDCTTYSLDRRADLRTARIGLAQRKISYEIAKNQLRPRFDITAAFALTGVASDYGDNLEGMFRGDYYTWQIGFEFEYPIGNRSAMASLRKSEDEFNKSKIQVLAAEQRAIFEVRTAIRNVRTDFRRISSALTSRMLAERTLSEETERYKVGRSTSIEVLRFQTDLIAAQNRELKAIIDYNLSISRLNRARFSNLADYRINIDDYINPSLNIPSWSEDDVYRPLIQLSKDSTNP